MSKLDGCAKLVLIIAAALFIYGIQRIDSVVVDEPLPTDSISGRWRGVDSRGEFTEINWHVDVYPATTKASEVLPAINAGITEALAVRRCGSSEAYQQVNMNIRLAIHERDDFYVQGIGVQMLCGDGWKQAR